MELSLGAARSSLFLKIHKKNSLQLITFFQVPPPLAVIISTVDAIWLLLLQAACPLLGEVTANISVL